MLKKTMKLVLLPAAAVLVACGGGGGGSASSPITLTGVAAYGAPYPVGSKLTVTDGSGKVIIDDEVYDAYSRGEFIDQGEKIKVISTEGTSLKVKKI